MFAILALIHPSRGKPFKIQIPMLKFLTAQLTLLILTQTYMQSLALSCLNLLAWVPSLLTSEIQLALALNEFNLILFVNGKWLVFKLYS